MIDQKPDVNAIKDNYNTMGGLMLAAGMAGFLLALFGFAISACRNLFSVFAVRKLAHKSKSQVYIKLMKRI